MTANLFLKPEWTTAQTNGAPDGWAFTFANQTAANSPITGGIPQETMPLPNQTLPFHQPRITTVAGLVSIALEFSPVWAGVAQLLTMSVGATYKLSVKVLPDLSHNGTPAGQDSSEFRLVARGASHWLSPIVGSINPYEVTFTADQANLNIGFEMRTRFGLSHIRWVLSEPMLTQVGTVPNGSGGTGAPGEPPASDKYAALERRLIALATVATLLADDATQLQYAIQNAQVELVRVKAGE